VSADVLRRFHATAAILWATAGTGYTLVWGADSILWVGIMSVYACAIGHFASYDAARAEAS
jgi:hypothetical protein